MYYRNLKVFTSDLEEGTHFESNTGLSDTKDANEDAAKGTAAGGV